MTATLGTSCGCGGGTATSGPVSAGERTRYYPRQLVGAADLTQDQLYFREKSRRHNRMLHGWGIVCGARVRKSATPGSVEIEPGYLLGPYGDEIMIDDLITVDLTAQNLDGDAANGCVPADPWCADVKVARPSDRPVYLAISYAEFACRPVQTATSGCGCGCDGGACEYSRLRDSYRIRVLDTLPATYPAVLKAPSPLIAFSCRRDTTRAGDDQACNCPTCAPCPEDPWVILADITMTGTSITKIDCDAHRRYVASFRDFFYVCTDAAQQLPGQSLLGHDAALANLRGVLSAAALAQITASPDLSAAVLAQPAASVDIGPEVNPELNRKIAALKVSDVLASTRDAFIASVTGGVQGADAQAVSAKAGQLWDGATAARTAVQDL
jgi:hypothetical protein